MNTARIAEEFIEGNPVIKDCLMQGLINYSKLSRMIIEKSKLDEIYFDAILVSCRRFFSKFKNTIISFNSVDKAIQNAKYRIIDLDESVQIAIKMNSFISEAISLITIKLSNARIKIVSINESENKIVIRIKKHDLVKTISVLNFTI